MNIKVLFVTTCLNLLAIASILMWETVVIAISRLCLALHIPSNAQQNCFRIEKKKHRIHTLNYFIFYFISLFDGKEKKKLKSINRFVQIRRQTHFLIG